MMFEASVRHLLRRDGVRLQGSLRTRRLRKKRYKHFEKLYPIYRDKLFQEKNGKSFAEWKNMPDKYDFPEYNWDIPKTNNEVPSKEWFAEAQKFRVESRKVDAVLKEIAYTLKCKVDDIPQKLLKKIL